MEKTRELNSICLRQFADQPFRLLLGQIVRSEDLLPFHVRKSTACHTAGELLADQLGIIAREADENFKDDFVGRLAPLVVGQKTLRRVPHRSVCVSPAENLEYAALKVDCSS